MIGLCLVLKCYRTLRKEKDVEQKPANVGFNIVDAADTKKAVASDTGRIPNVADKVLVVNNRERHRRFIINAFRTFADDNKKLNEAEITCN